MSQPPTLQLQPPNLNGERILAFGAESVGKTWSWFRMVEASQGRAFVLDTDRAVGRFLASPRWTHLSDRVTHVVPKSWPDYMKPMDAWQEQAQMRDWLVIDLFGRAWDEVQEHFTKEVFGVGHDEHLLGYRKHLEAKGGKGSKSEFDATIDWPVVKGMYRRLTTAILDWPGHVYLACGKKSINEQYDDSSTKERYQPVGCKPDAEKTAGHLVHTILYMGANRRVTSLKDRERKLLDGTKVEDMALGYLVGVAGWRPVA